MIYKKSEAELSLSFTFVPKLLAELERGSLTFEIPVNGPFPSSSGPLFQNEGRFSAFDMEMIFHSYAHKLIFTRKVVYLASF